jgi:hypothetical protein
MKRIIAIGIILVLIGCKKDPPPEPLEEFENGILVLNEGLYQQNNASISFYSLATQEVVQQAFLSKNDRGLGDTANDWEYFGFNGIEYIIIAVDISSQIEIIELNTLKSVAQIPVFDGTIAREPRSVKVSGDKAFSCNYDGTVSVIDLNSNSIVNTIQVGDNPDDISIVGDKLYVANSGGLNFPIYDSTVTVIDIPSQTVETEIPSRINCTSMIQDAYGDVYIQSQGDYSSITPAMLRLNTQTNTIDDTVDVAIGSWDLYNDYIYYYDANLNGIYRYNTISELQEGIQIIDCSDYQTVYGVYVTINHIYTVDANGYVNSSTVRCYNHSGGFQYEFTAGLNATDLIFN